MCYLTLVLAFYGYTILFTRTFDGIGNFVIDLVDFVHGKMDESFMLFIASAFFLFATMWKKTENISRKFLS